MRIYALSIFAIEESLICENLLVFVLQQVLQVGDVFDQVVDFYIEFVNETFFGLVLGMYLLVGCSERVVLLGEDLLDFNKEKVLLVQVSNVYVLIVYKRIFLGQLTLYFFYFLLKKGCIFY